MKKNSTAILLFALLVSACCPLISENPLSDPEKAEYDKRMEGTWRLIPEENEHVYLHIGRLTGNKMMALSVEHKKNGGIETKKLPFFITETNKNRYLNLRIEDIVDKLSQEQHGFIFVKYNIIKKNTLLVYNLEQEPIIQAIKSKKLQGEIIYRKQVLLEGFEIDKSSSEPKADYIKLTDISKNILHFLESETHKKLFPKSMKFIRIHK